MSSGIWNQIVRPRCHKNDCRYLIANYTFKYRQQNASGTNIVLQFMLIITYQPKANTNMMVLEKAMESNLFKMSRFRLNPSINVLVPNFVP